LAFTNFPAAGAAGSVTIQVSVSSVAHTLTLPVAVTLGTTGIQGISGQVITFGATGTYNFRFTTSDGGSTITVFDLNRPLNSYTNPLFLTGAQSLSSTGAASLTTTASYFTTVSSATATLAAGAAGQVKTFMMVADGGDMVITVNNAGWKSSGTGTITFNDIGDGCTLQYNNAKWYCIGNNGAVFA
jgi:hypothetical protein